MLRGIFLGLLSQAFCLRRHKLGRSASSICHRAGLFHTHCNAKLAPVSDLKREPGPFSCSCEPDSTPSIRLPSTTWPFRRNGSQERTRRSVLPQPSGRYHAGRQEQLRLQHFNPGFRRGIPGFTRTQSGTNARSKHSRIGSCLQDQVRLDYPLHRTC